MEAEQGIEVNIRLVHGVEGIRLRFEDVQFIAVVPPAMRNVDVGRNAAPEIQEGVHLHGSPAVFPECPRCQPNAGGYGSGIEGLEDIVCGYL